MALAGGGGYRISAYGGASIAGLIRPFATPYRARNVGNIVGNENFRIFFFCDFNSLWRKFYSNSGSQKNQRFTSPLLSKKIEIFRRGAIMVPDWLGLVALALPGRASASFW